MASEDDGLLQDLLNFTVEIRDAEGKVRAGTGIVIDAAGKVVTCAHVVKAVLGRHPREANGAEVGVYFPLARGGEGKSRCAVVAACFREWDDDVVVLQLVDGPAPLGPEQIAVLGSAELSEGNGFRSYGFAQLGTFPASRAGGAIMGRVPPPTDENWQVFLVQLESHDIVPGMSGAAVLDEKRNLVVGIISERWKPISIDDTRQTGWSVDAHVLTFNPFNLNVRTEPLPKRPYPTPRTDMPTVQAAAAPSSGFAWNNAPRPLAEWVGREELLKAITTDWLDPNRRVTGLIGFGGEGKSSLARKWIDRLLASEPAGEAAEGVGIRPDGVLWWGFYDNANVDAFFEAALKYMSAGRIDPRKVPSANIRGQIIGATLGAGRYVFVLDGLEVMQYQDGDEYGLLKSADLREFLGYFATPGHSSFCLITSRAPLFDLMEYTTYTHRDVDHLSTADGRALLCQIGVRGPDPTLDAVVHEWDGHALTLGLLGGYLTDRYSGAVTHIGDIPAPTADEPRYERVYRVLRRYDDHLSGAERAFLTLFSAFRTPVKETAFEKVFRANTDATSLNAPIAELTGSDFAAMPERLRRYRILRRDDAKQNYTLHPLARAHYLARLNASDPTHQQAVYERITNYFLDVAGDTPYKPTLNALHPLIEAVHYACCARQYDAAYRILRDRIYSTGHILTRGLGAWETAYTLLLEFFSGDDARQDPLVDDARHKNWLLNEVGLCLMNLGRLEEAAPFFQRSLTLDESLTLDLSDKDWQGSITAYQHLAELHFLCGQLDDSEEAARASLELARYTQGTAEQVTALSYLARTALYRGNREMADDLLAEARSRATGLDYSQEIYDIVCAAHLARIGEFEDATRITRGRLDQSAAKDTRSPSILSRCCRIMGDIYLGAGQRESSKKYYSAALKIAKRLSDRTTYVEALMANGRAAVERGEHEAARMNLNEALMYASMNGYRLYEADIRVGLARAQLGAGNKAVAAAEAERAHSMSAVMEYHWGQVEAAQLLASIS